MSSPSSRTTSSAASLAFAALSALPAALAVTPSARWGHQAVYVSSQQAMYVVGGEVSSSNSEITNEVLILDLNSTSASFTTGTSTNLPPHAYGSMTVTPDSSAIVLTGGMTSSCSSDSTTHTLDLTSGDGSWVGTSPSNFVRRRNAGVAWVDNGSTEGEVMVVGGIADSYSCASSTSAYTASDVLSLPLSSTALVSSRSLPTALTGSTQAVADFGMTKDASGNIYLVGGQSASGDLVDLDTIGVWTSSSGWAAQTTSGDVPSGRVGASLVAHPTLDLLVLHGGSVTNSTTNSDTPTSLLALLNTTSWSWSTPSDLQPPASSAASYHSSVMTDQGVMITAFGLSATGSARSDIFYLDMRDPTGSAWSWKSTWSSSMLSAYSASGTSDSSDTSGSTVNTNTVATSTGSSSGTSAKKVASIAVPVLVVCILILPIIVYLIRRRVRLIKKRRMARHFSFSSQEDSGFFSGPLDRYLGGGGRRTKTQHLFGTDANEKDGNVFTDLSAGLGRMVSRLSSRSNSDDDHHSNASHSDREMIQVPQAGTTGASFNKKQPMNWEEIDFGLGKLDAEKAAGTQANPFEDDANAIQMPVASTRTGYTPEMLQGINPTDGPEHDANMVYNLHYTTADENNGGNGLQQQRLPSLVVMPATPSVNSLNAYPAMRPASPHSQVPVETATTTNEQGQGLDWSILEKELDAKPAFRSISPNAQLGRPLPQAPIASGISRTESPRPMTPPSIPPLDFQRGPSSPIGQSQSQGQGQTITLVNPKTGRRTSELLPFNSDSGSQSPRSVSQPQPFILVGGRQLTGNNGQRRASASGPVVTPTGAGAGGDSPLSSGQTTPRGPITSNATRRASAGSLKYISSGSPSATGTVSSQRRTSQLRVVNRTDSDSEDEGSSGKAL